MRDLTTGWNLPGPDSCAGFAPIPRRLFLGNFAQFLARGRNRQQVPRRHLGKPTRQQIAHRRLVFPPMQRREANRGAGDLAQQVVGVDRDMLEPSPGMRDDTQPHRGFHQQLGKLGVGELVDPHCSFQQAVRERTLFLISHCRDPSMLPHAPRRRDRRPAALRFASARSFNADTDACSGLPALPKFAGEMEMRSVRPNTRTISSWAGFPPRIR